MVFNMAIATNLQTNINNQINTYGRKVVVYNRTATYDSYDQETLTTSGSSCGSAIIMPITEQRGGTDFQFLQQGLIQLDDLKVFIPSGVSVDENDLVAFSTGSYSVIRIYDWETEGTIIYKKLYIRKWTQP